MQALGQNHCQVKSYSTPFLTSAAEKSHHKYSNKTWDILFASVLPVLKLTETRTASPSIHKWLRNILLYRSKQHSASDQKTWSCIIHPWMVPWATVDLSDWGPKCKRVIYQRKISKLLADKIVCFIKKIYIIVLLSYLSNPFDVLSSLEH